MVVWAARGQCASIAFCGFETTGDNWSFTSAIGGSYNADWGASDTPPGQRIRTGSSSWIVGGTTTSTSSLSFSEILLSGYGGVEVAYHVSSTAADGDHGHSGYDTVVARLAETVGGLDAAAALVTLPGGGKQNWGYSDAAQCSTTYPSSGCTAGTGTSSFRISIPTGQFSIALRLYANSNSANTYWNLDDVALSGTATTSHGCCWAGGANVWSASAACWIDQGNGGTATAWNNLRGDNAFFTAAAGTATIAAGTTTAVRSITFDADRCAIIGDTSSRLALVDGGSGGAGANTIEVSNAGHTATITAAITGNPNVGLVKTGPGTLVLRGVNSYTGTTSILAGAVRISHDYNLNAAGTTVSLDGGTLQFAAAVDLAAKYPLAFQTAGGTIDTSGYACSADVNGWTGAGGMTKTGAGKLSLRGDNAAFSGAVEVRQGTLSLGSSGTLQECSTLTVCSGAVLDLPAGYCLGSDQNQKLFGAGAIVGNLTIAGLGEHDVGNSPAVQTICGNYVMAGDLLVELDGPAPGDNASGYDQIVIAGDPTDKFDVTLSGVLSLTWGGAGWSSATDRLWIILNNTTGGLSGSFSNCPDGQVVGQYDGRQWVICYAADFTTKTLAGGNDVVLVATATVPEPATFVLLLIFGMALWLVRMDWLFKTVKMGGSVNLSMVDVQ